MNGSYAEYGVAGPNYVGHLPSNVAFDEIAPIVCTGVTVYKGIRVTDTRPGQWIAISRPKGSCAPALALSPASSLARSIEACAKHLPLRVLAPVDNARCRS
ncbi:hypothetical protein WS70_27220 [Burkholderia mayonis]|uniref:Uncharacterized protein n=1 Tax=Burkholderia mayonis TaxID=1385591 RepID=A0A1B4FNZ2_9BURK|nr:hypothetical protein WS70_27220 [Burkholderia mayonis]KVE42972.1 hypothetical protein WS69_24500 [Burkholderia sp. BDU5]KVE47904.1 hypothetical protein WS70_25540 [Burkholderia mayonis]